MHSITEFGERCSGHQQRWDAVPLAQGNRCVDAIPAVSRQPNIDNREIARRTGRDCESGPKSGRDSADRMAKILEHGLQVQAGDRFILDDQHSQRSLFLGCGLGRECFHMRKETYPPVEGATRKDPAARH